MKIQLDVKARFISDFKSREMKRHAGNKNTHRDDGFLSDCWHIYKKRLRDEMHINIESIDSISVNISLVAVIEFILYITYSSSLHHRSRLSLFTLFLYLYYMSRPRE